jgi:hypothetical protein
MRRLPVQCISNFSISFNTFWGAVRGEEALGYPIMLAFCFGPLVAPLLALSLMREFERLGDKPESVDCCA